MDRGAWRAIVYEVTESWTQLKQLSTQICKIMSSIVKVSKLGLMKVTLLDQH